MIVIVHPGVRFAEVSKSDLRDAFSGASSSLKVGSHVIPVLLKPGTAHDEFLSTHAGKNDTAFRANWRSLVCSGQASLPKPLESEAVVVEYLAHNPGAVG